MEQTREITVKGIGKLSLKPDWLQVELSLERTNEKYVLGYKIFTVAINNIQQIVAELAFSKDELKTDLLNITTDKEYKNGKYVPKGFSFSTRFTLSFPFDAERLNKVIGKLSESDAKPEIEVRFTVKNPEEAKNKLLAQAAKDAQQKAEVLCSAMNVKLGTLQRIHYNWDELDIYSNMDFQSNIPVGCACEASSIDFNPSEIDLTDNATFVWKIED